MSEPSKKARELVDELSRSAFSHGFGITSGAITWEAGMELLSYIATLERDHRAMERLRETGMHWRFVQGGLRSSLKSEVGPAPGHYTDPADAILEEG